MTSFCTCIILKFVFDFKSMNSRFYRNYYVIEKGFFFVRRPYLEHSFCELETSSVRVLVGAKPS